MKKLLIILFAATLSVGVHAQRFAVKTNALYDLALVPSLGFEMRLNPVVTLDISGTWTPFKLKECLGWKNWSVQPELRIWTCEAFNGTFLGIHAIGGEYSFRGLKMPFGLVPELKDSRYEGHFIGGGLVIGHQWMLGSHWSIEGVLGVGYARLFYKQYECVDCAPVKSKGWDNYYGPTKAAVNFLYFF